MNSNIQQLPLDSTVPSIEKMIPIFIGTSKIMYSEKPVFTDTSYEAIQLSVDSGYKIDKTSIIPYITYWKEVSTEFSMNFITPTYIVYMPSVLPGKFDKNSMFMLYDDSKALLFSSKIKSFVYENSSLVSIELVDKCPLVGDYNFILMSKVKETVSFDYDELKRILYPNYINNSSLISFNYVVPNESTITYNIYSKTVDLKFYETISEDDIKNEQNLEISKGLSLSNSAIVISIANESYLLEAIEQIKRLGYGYYIVPINLSFNSVQLLASFVKEQELENSYLALLIPAQQAEGNTLISDMSYYPPTFLWYAYGPSSGTPIAYTTTHALVGNKLFIAPTSFYSSTETNVFDFSTDTWSNGPTLPTPYSGVDAAIFTSTEVPVLPDGRIYLQQINANGPMLVDINTGVVTSLSARPVGQTGGNGTYVLYSDAVVLAPNGKIYYFGEDKLGTPYSGNNILTHDPINDVWARVNESSLNWLNQAIPLHIGNGKYFILQGRDTNQQAHIFDTTNNTWATTSINSCGLSSDTNNHYRSILMKDGRVFTAGGTTAKCSIYDPVTNLFSTYNTPGTFDVNPGLFLMDDGRIHVIGKYNSGGSYIFNPEDNTCSAIYSMPNTFTNATITHPINGKPLSFRNVNGGVSILFSIFDGK